MPKKETLKQNNQPTGKVLVEWTFPEYVQYERSKKWYIWAGVIMGLLLIYTIFTLNFLFAVIIILFGIILFTQNKKSPHDVDFRIYEDGIQVSSKFYKFREIGNFWLIYDPPDTKNLYLSFKSKVRPILTIPLQKKNPVQIRRILLEHVDEDLDKEEESFAEILGRRLKI